MKMSSVPRSIKLKMLRQEKIDLQDDQNKENRLWAKEWLYLFKRIHNITSMNEYDIICGPTGGFERVIQKIERRERMMKELGLWLKALSYVLLFIFVATIVVSLLFGYVLLSLKSGYPILMLLSPIFLAVVYAVRRSL